MRGEGITITSFLEEIGRGSEGSVRGECGAAEGGREEVYAIFSSGPGSECLEEALLFRETWIQYRLKKKKKKEKKAELTARDEKRKGGTSRQATIKAKRGSRKSTAILKRGLTREKGRTDLGGRKNNDQGGQGIQTKKKGREGGDKTFNEWLSGGREEWSALTRGVLN